MQDTWSWRDGPLLNAVVEGLDDSGGTFVEVRPKRFADLLALKPTEVEAGMNALAAAGHIREFTRFAGGWLVQEVSGHARRLVGAWPGDDAAERFLAGLDQLIAASSGPEKSKLEMLKGVAVDLWPSCTRS